MISWSAQYLVSKTSNKLPGDHANYSPIGTEARVPDWQSCFLLSVLFFGKQEGVFCTGGNDTTIDKKSSTIPFLERECTFLFWDIGHTDTTGWRDFVVNPSLLQLLVKLRVLTFCTYLNELKIMSQSFPHTLGLLGYQKTKRASTRNSWRVFQNFKGFLIYIRVEQATDKIILWKLELNKIEEHWLPSLAGYSPEMRAKEWVTQSPTFFPPRNLTSSRLEIVFPNTLNKLIEIHQLEFMLHF